MSFTNLRNSFTFQRLFMIIDKALGRWVRPCLYGLSPLLLFKYRYKMLKGIWLNLNNPKTYDEKVIWLNLYWRHPLKTQCADKYGLRSYVASQGYDHLLPELLGLYNRSSEIDFASLPNKFALKCTHGCKFNVICEDKRQLNIRHTRRMLDKWLKQRISRIWGEVHYDAIHPRIICEAFLDDISGGLPIDYKVHCFNGKPRFTMVCVGRDLSGYNAKYAFYDLDWKTIPFYCDKNVFENKNILKPEGYEEMIKAAEELARPFPFVRIDFYIIKGAPVIGEMTFTPDGCIDEDLSDIGQRILGELIALPSCTDVTEMVPNGREKQKNDT